jgi:tRNA A-37 threonylcarbamoyl transferase component Bud32
MPIEVGQVFAGYTIERVLGTGGMGTVYLAAHPRLPRNDALKVLPADLTADPEFRARFLREADLAAGLSHPNIVSIHDRGEDDGHFWIAMDYVAGTDAGELLRERYPRGMPLDEALSIVTAIGLALDYAHRRGLLHRDVKPANVLLTEPDGQERRVLLADFGIARRIDDAAGLTATNMTVGTVAYAAPEQLKGEAIDGRADQYALACTAFHLLTGETPYVHSNPAVVITQHVIAPPASIGARRPELAALDWVFAVAMAKSPSARFGSCGEFAHELRQSLIPGLASGRREAAFPGTRPILAATAPTPTLPPASPVGKRRASRRRLLIPALLGIALLIGGGVFAVNRILHHKQPPTPIATEGPFTGTYRTDFGPLNNGIDGATNSGVPPSITSTYGVRSICRPTGCVAAAARLGGVPVGATTVTLDRIGGIWVGVVLGSDQCQGANIEFFQVFTLQSRSPGVFAGALTAMSGNVCANTRTVTFTRTGDVDVGKVPDPAGQPARVESPAEALHGRYQSTRTFTNGLPPAQQNYTVTTRCLRTGDRCMSYFHASSSDAPLVFGSGKWIWDVDGLGQCGSGASTHLRDTGQYPLPQPAQNPIVRLTGHGHHEQSAPCAASGDFDETFTRTGD